ncbi:hypothetical protein TRICI_005245 [Trichomonascus ciferrii]|uniref:Nuclear control of ATPase protein 2 n=1 Tax=Trichomonascus ciferrii TaxID=44093 RepID=A0A642UUM7_9ASCO|nr:hypothetical protein TRICI_005245 [Trichomonascus ciferrii]
MNRVVEFEKYLDQRSIELAKRDQSGLISVYGNQQHHHVNLKQLRSYLLLSAAQEGSSQQRELGLALGCVALFKHCTAHLLEKTLPVMDHIRYYDDVLESGPVYGLAMFAMQNAPTWLYRNYRTVNPVEVLRNPLSYTAIHVSSNRRKLKQLRDSYARRLGKLVSLCFNKDDLGANVIQSIQIMHEVMREDADKQSAAHHPLDMMLDIIDNGFVRDPDAVLTEYGRPGVLTRYWPLLALSGYAGLKVLGNWRALLDWMKVNFVDTSISLWNNWILAPLGKIYQTIRHDENAQIALMNKHSLDSDMKSLERMVIDFVGQENPALVQAVQQGDLSSVLSRYEKQIQTPIRSIINGELIRSILIQVQKTKVDVEVAMNGIDKMLQSQQLVFGLVAALPSFFILWYGFSFISRKSGSQNRRIQNVSKAKHQIKLTLGYIDQLLATKRHDDDQLSYEHLGLVICHTHSVRQQAKSILSQSRYKQLIARLQKLEDITSVQNARTDLRDIFIQFDELK